jgi:hypothetical protein
MSPGDRPDGWLGEHPGDVSDVLSRLDPVHLRQPDIHEHDVGFLAVGETDSFATVRGFGDHFHVWRGVEQEPERRPEQCLVTLPEGCGCSSHLVFGSPIGRAGRACRPGPVDL